MRSSLLLRMRAAAMVGTSGLRAELERHLALHREQLEEYLAIEVRDFRRSGGAPGRTGCAISSCGAGSTWSGSGWNG